jgi:phosphoglycolate phosphatase-like HAD superfamily hydrolase
MQTLVLFDIDGTLVRGGPAKEAFRMGLEHAFGTSGRIDVHDFAGKTDPQIARELLTAAGVAHPDVDQGLPSLWDRYLAELEARLPAEPMELLPGVADLLDALARAGGVALGLVTGNIARGAILKLGSVGLAGRFQVGGFGSDSEARERLPAIAMQRAASHFGVSFQRRQVVVVGDTPRDVACGLHEGVRTLGVGTGRFDVESLLESGAHAALSDFTDTEQVMACLLEGAG